MHPFAGLPLKARALAEDLLEELGPLYGARAWSLAKAVALRSSGAGFAPGYYLAHDEDGFEVILWVEPLVAKAESLAPGERWITLKPHGPDSPDYVRVKIRIWSDGTAHVISGPKGLTGLRLTKLGEGKGGKKRGKGTPLDRESKEAVQRAYAEAAQRAQSILDHPSLERLADPKLKEKLKAALAQGDSEMAGGAGIAAARQVRRLQTTLHELERRLVDRLSEDDTLREAVLSRPEEPTGGKGYAPDLKGEAQERGYTPKKAREEEADFEQKRLQEMTPEEAEALINRRLAAKRVAEAARALTPEAERAVPRPKPPAPDELVTKAEDVRDFLEAMRQVRQVKRLARVASIKGDPEARAALRRTLDRTAYPIRAEEVDPEATKELEERIQAHALEKSVREFLDLSYGQEPEWTPLEARKAMLKWHRAGVYAHLADTGQVLLGREPVDRLVVDALGPEAAVALAARAIRKELPPEHLERAKKALEDNHEELLKRIPEAMERARKALEAAQKITLPEVAEGTEAMATRTILKERRRLLEEARRELGGLLGQIESSALLNYALREGDLPHLEVEFGDQPVREAAMALRALGLEDGDYEWEKEKGNLVARIPPQGQDRLLAQAPSTEERETLERVKAIKRGEEDEENWLPAGFTRYPKAALDAQAEELPKPMRYASPPNFSGDLQEGIERFAGERLADGWTPLEIKRTLSSMDFMRDWVPEGREEEYLQALEKVLPTYAGEEERKNKQGETYRVSIPIDYAHLEEKHPELHERLRGLAQKVAGKDAYPEETLEDTPETRKALYLSLLQDPRHQLAWKPLGDLSPQDQTALRGYYLTEVLGIPPEELARRKEGAKRALEEYEKAHPEPPKWGQDDGMSLFSMEDSYTGGPITLRFRTQDSLRIRRLLKALNLNKEGEDYVANEDGTITLTERGKERLTPPADPDDLDALASDLPLSPQWKRWHQGRKAAAAQALGEKELVEWPQFVELMGSRERAYLALQEHMRGRVAGDFARRYAALTGKPLRVSKKENPYGEHLWAIHDPESYAEFKRRQREAMEGLRARDQGKFAHMGGRGSLLDAYRAMREQQRAGRGAQSLLLSGAEEKDPRLEADETVPYLERPALAPGVENRLAAMTGSVVGGLTPDTPAVKVIPGLTMGKGTRFVKQQRAIRSIIAGKKMAMFLGVGSGKTGVSLGAFTELHHQGKAKKGLFIVPSIVRNQFGEEMARFLEPGKYRWHAREASHEERLAALKDPETHLVSMTHQSFRDTLLRLMAEHHKQDEERFKDRFLEAPLPERQRLMRETLEAHGIPLDYLALDEAHDALNRKRKEESLLSAVLDTAMSLSKHGVLMTGTPVKNDASEIGDWLKKVDPEKFGDQKAFMRRYGVDAHIARDALKRLAERYTYHDVVPSGTKKTEVWGDHAHPGNSPTGHAPIPLHPAQQERVRQIEEAYRAARRARAKGQVDLEALRILSPESFQGVPPEEHQALAKRLSQSLGVLRHSAMSRAIDEAPAEGNAKIQHLLRLADERRGKGGVIFASRRKAVDEIARALSRAGHRVAVLHGGHSAEEKARIRDRFNRGDVDILVMSDAGATGANLQGRGEWLAHYDLPMTWKTFEQRTARIDRLGQTKPIEVHALMTDTDYDRENHRRLKEKRLLGDIFHGPYESTDDRGLALKLKLMHRDDDLREVSDGESQAA